MKNDDRVNQVEILGLPYFFCFFTEKSNFICYRTPYRKDINENSNLQKCLIIGQYLILTIYEKVVQIRGGFGVIEMKI